jgi:hypothetical protein
VEVDSRDVAQAAIQQLQVGGSGQCHPAWHAPSSGTACLDLLCRIGKWTSVAVIPNPTLPFAHCLLFIVAMPHAYVPLHCRGPS